LIRKRVAALLRIFFACLSHLQTQPPQPLHTNRFFMMARQVSDVNLIRIEITPTGDTDIDFRGTFLAQGDSF
jgi:hypothetical protein